MRRTSGEGRRKTGCHLNPAVTVGLTVAHRFPVAEVVLYVVAQVLGAAAGAGVLYLVASGRAGFDLAAGFASNGFAEHSPGGYSLASGLLMEAVMTFAFLFVILGAPVVGAVTAGVVYPWIAGVGHREEAATGPGLKPST